MYGKRVVLLIIYLGLSMVCVSLTACNSKNAVHPASSLQNLLASILADPQGCPGGNSQDVQKLVNSAGVGGTIRLPEGCYRINSTINLLPCISLIGAGADKTILYLDPGGYHPQSILRVTGKSVENCRTQISGLSLLGVRDSDDTGQDYGLIISNVQDFRIDHAYFEGFGFAAVRVEGNSSGVVDHCIFIDNYKRGIDSLGYGVVVYGKGLWEAEPQAGGSQATFVEDSLFVGNRHAIAASSGAHYVFRNNQVLHNVMACAVDAHGMGFTSAHGTRYVEIYHNIIDDPIYNRCGIGIRGGAGVIFENTIQGYKKPILLILEWGTPDRYKAEYPALDQVQELYIWGNEIKGGAADPQVDMTGKGFIEIGRDYFTEPLPGYVPYEYPHPFVNNGPFDAAAWPPPSTP